MLMYARPFLLRCVLRACLTVNLSQLAIINGGFIRGNRVYEQGYSFTLGDVEREFPFPKKPFFIETLGMPAASPWCSWW